MILEHDSDNLIYRNPFGALETGKKITLRIGVSSEGIPKKVICVANENEIMMHYYDEINNTRIYECSFEMPENPCLVFYYFYVVADGTKLYYGNNDYALGGKGKEWDTVPTFMYQITVYEKGFKTPDWMKNAIVYQIFPDRFYRSGNTPFHGIERTWGDEPFYTAEQFGGTYLSNDFFGGTLKGIEEKIPYLKDLGISAIYLNPIFKAFSNHRYDTSDYEITDDTLGTVDDFKSLAKIAQKHGIKLILDGVFSHTGSDSKYFNKYGHFDSLGAYESKDSPYYSWYTFSSFPDKYESWWGFETLPNVNEMDSKYLDYIAGNKNSIIKKWLQRGAFGWRLDVADELPDEFIYELRKAIKSENEDALLLGEVWEDASHKVSYGVNRKFLLGKWLDSVMNYVFRHAVLSYLLHCDSALFIMRIKSLLENYPLESLYTSLNLISSHDVPRAMTVLSEAPDFRTLKRCDQHDYVIEENKLYLARKRMKLAIALQMTLPGVPTIYYGDEMEMTGYADPFNRECFPWEKERGEIFFETKKLCSLRNKYQCLKTGDFKCIYYVNGVICFMRSIENNKDVFSQKYKNESILVICNSSHNSEQLNLELERFHVSEITDAFTGERADYNYNITFDIAPLSYRIFKLERKNNKCTKIQSTQSE